MCHKSSRRAHPAFAGYGPQQNAFYGPPNAYGEPSGVSYGPGPVAWGPSSQGRGCGWGRRGRCHGSFFGFVAGKIQEKQVNRLAHQQLAYQAGQSAPPHFVQQPYQAPEQYQRPQPHYAVKAYHENEARAREEPTDEKAKREDDVRPFQEENDIPPPRYSVAVGERK